MLVANLRILKLGDYRALSMVKNVPLRGSRVLAEFGQMGNKLNIFLNLNS